MAKDVENIMVDNSLYILTALNPETTNGAIVQLTQWIEKMPFVKKGDMFFKSTKIATASDSTLKMITAKEVPTTIYTPYDEMPEHIPVLNVYLNSPGGGTALMKSILSMFNIASAKGAIIRTYNIGRANSCASMIAVSGTRGYRYMSENAQNFIHWGESRPVVNHPDEVEYAKKDLDNEIGLTSDIYLNNSNLTKEELSQFYNIEGSGRLFADQCLEKGLCDWVVTNDGRYVNKVSELKSKQR